MFLVEMQPQQYSYKFKVLRGTGERKRRLQILVMERKAASDSLRHRQPIAD